MRADDPSSSARHDITTARDVFNHRPIDMEDEPLREDESLLRAEPRGDNLAGQQPPASDRHTDRDSNSEHDNNKPSTSMASSVGTTSTKVNKSSVVRVNGQVHRVRTLQTVIETSILPRYADSEMFLDDTRTLYAERTVRVVEEGFKEAPQLKQD